MTALAAAAARERSSLWDREQGILHTTTIATKAADLDRYDGGGVMRRGWKGSRNKAGTGTVTTG